MYIYKSVHIGAFIWVLAPLGIMCHDAVGSYEPEKGLVDVGLGTAEGLPAYVETPL